MASVDRAAAAVGGADRRGGGGHGHRCACRPGRGGRQDQRGNLAHGRRIRPRDHRRGSSGSVQPGRSGLGTAPVEPVETGGARVRTVPRHGAGRPEPCGRAQDRPHHRFVPAVVGARGARAQRGHLRALQPRGADRDPGAGGASRPGPGGGGGPRHRRTLGARIPVAPRPAGHRDPVVGVRNRRAGAAPGEVARVLHGLGHHPRPASHPRIPRERSCQASGTARVAAGTGRAGTCCR